MNIAKKILELADQSENLSEETLSELNRLLYDLILEMHNQHRIQVKVPPIGIVTRIIGQETLHIRSCEKSLLWDVKDGIR